MSIEPIILETEHHSNGNKKHEKSIVEVDGEQLVLEIDWYENGVKLNETLYHWPDESGNIDDLYIISKTSWRDDGQIKEEYTLNKPHKVEYDIGDTVSYRKYYDYYDNGQIKSENHYKEIFTDIAWGNENDPVLVKGAKARPSKQEISHGKSIDWYENGQIKDEMSYKDDKFDGKKTAFYMNGQKLSEGNYVNDLLEGEWCSWYEDGSRCRVEKIINGKRIWTEWDESGNIISQENMDGETN